MKIIEVTRRGVTIKIRQATSTKHGVNYTEYQIADYSSGKRVRHSRATLPDAKAKALEICEAMAARKTEILRLKDRVWDDIHGVMDALIKYELGLPEASQILVSALSTGICANEILVACQHWMITRPGKRFIPKRTSDAANEFMATQNRNLCKRI